MEQPKVTIIIPIYNVEPYIERCARSLFEQTLDSIEFIFIDDCTPDNSINILRQVLSQYPKRVNQTKILKMPHNSGLPEVRRFGIGQATGHYVAHCDSDDWVDLNMYEQLYNKAMEEDADMVVCPFMESDDVNSPTLLACLPCAKNGEISNKLSCWENEGSLCNKLIKRKLYDNDITFPTENMGEDMCLIYQLIYFCKKFSYVPNVHYYIYRNPNSITRTPTQTNIYKNFLQGCSNCKIVENFYIRHNAIDKDTRRALMRLKYSKRDILRPIVGKTKYHKIWCEMFPEIDSHLLTNDALTFREKLKSFFIRLRLFPLPWKRCLIKE